MFLSPFSSSFFPLSSSTPILLISPLYLLFLSPPLSSPLSSLISRPPLSFILLSPSLSSFILLSLLYPFPFSPVFFPKLVCIGLRSGDRVPWRCPGVPWRCPGVPWRCPVIQACSHGLCWNVIQRITIKLLVSLAVFHPHYSFCFVDVFGPVNSVFYVYITGHI